MSKLPLKWIGSLSISNEKYKSSAVTVNHFFWLRKVGLLESAEISYVYALYNDNKTSYNSPLDKFS